MSTTQKKTTADQRRVWAVLSDPSSYGEWVVGSKEIRSVSGEWPEPGARLHHTVGVGPAENKDDTVVLESNAPRHIKLRVQFRPLGVGQVTIDVGDDPTDSGEDRKASVIVMHEIMIGGIASVLPQRLLDFLLHPRNVKTLERLADLAETRL